MASSENQGLQITLIIFVILTIILAVTTFVFVRQWSEVRDQRDKEKTDNAVKTDGLNKAVQEIERMRQMIGLPEAGGAPGAGIGAAEEQFKKDMQTWAATFPEEKQRYRDALEQVYATLNAMSAQLREEQAKSASLAAQAEQREADKQKQIEEFTGQLQSARDDLAGERAKFKADLERITLDNDDLKRKLSERQAELDTRVKEFDADKKRYDNEVSKRDAQIDNLSEQVREATIETFEVADGEVVRVDMARRLVWINLGRDDHLRPRITFAVYSGNENDVARYAKKGSVEVTNVLGAKLAECRITDDAILNPITPGDKIYTPAWHPGRQEHFALLGVLDIDGDEASDRQTVRDLIALAGGVVDAELDDKGKRIGEMTLNTRYLVQGEQPEVSGLEGDDQLKKFNEMVREAKSLGIEMLTIDKFLDHVGFKDPKRLLHFKTSGAMDFRSDRADGGYPTSPGTTTELFRQRIPGSKGYMSGAEATRPKSDGNTSEIYQRQNGSSKRSYQRIP